MQLQKLMDVSVERVENGVLLTARLVANEPFVSDITHGPRYHASLEEAVDTLPRVLVELSGQKLRYDLERAQRDLANANGSSVQS
jgi:hypothetical protein